MQTTAIKTVANSLPENEVILLTHLISTRYIPYTDLRKIYGISAEIRQKCEIGISFPGVQIGQCQDEKRLPFLWECKQLQSFTQKGKEEILRQQTESHFI